MVEEGYFLRPPSPLNAVSMFKGVNVLFFIFNHRLELVVG